MWRYAAPELQEQRQQSQGYERKLTSEKQWIVYAGTSRLRGVFLAAVDHLIGGKSGEFAQIDKCWGRMDVELGTLRLTYQDDSLYPLRTPNEPRTFQCHNTKQVTFDGIEFFHNAMQFVSNMFNQDIASAAVPQPTALVIEYVLRAKPGLYRDMLFQHLPPSWSGTVVAIFFRSQLTRTLDRPVLTAQDKAAWTAAIGWDKAEVVDTHDMITPWMRSAEYGAGQASQHWHSRTKPSAAATRMPFAIKGLITDMLAQMVFNKALGPKPSGDDAAEVRSDGEGVNSTGDKHATVRARRARHRHVIARATESQTKQPALRVCTDCPGGIMPFHLKLMTDMRNSCYDHVPVLDYKAQYIEEVPACPGWCMKQRANYTIETQSEPVRVRECMEQKAEGEGQRSGLHVCFG